MEDKKPLTEDDLSNVYFRARDENGQWFNQNAKDATDSQFDIWAKSHIEIIGNDGNWSLDDRRAFCDMLCSHRHVKSVGQQLEGGKS